MILVTNCGKSGRYVPLSFMSSSRFVLGYTASQERLE
jgi:hypothetical protein